MKAFFVLACAALAVADPATIVNTPYGQTIVPDMYDAINPFNALVNPMMNQVIATPNHVVAPNVVAPYSIAAIPKTVTTTYVGKKPVTSLYNQPQAEKDSQEMAIMNAQLEEIKKQQDALNAGDQAKIMQSYSAQQQMNMAKAAVPKPAAVKHSLEDFTVQQKSIVFKREADPAVVVRGYSGIYGVPTLGGYYGYRVPSVYSGLYNRRFLLKREAEAEPKADPALVVRGYSGIYGVPTLGGYYGYGVPSVYSGLYNRRFLLKREAEAEPKADPAVLVGGYSSIYGYRYPSVIGSPFVRSLRTPFLGYY